ncbi:MAG: hypothetical protein ACO1OK_07310 [Devosia sp.]
MRRSRATGWAGAEPMPAAPARRLLVISNGMGEDSIAAALIARLPASIHAEAYPTLGPGAAFEGLCPVVGPRAELASQGSRVRAGTVARDVATGGLATIPPGLSFLRQARNAYDRVLVIGDMMGVLGCWLTGHAGIVWLDVYRSGHGRLYGGLEKAIIGRSCATVFCRSGRLAESLKAAGIDARFAGNVMMDTVARAPFAMTERRRRQRAVTLLPGSRADAAEIFAIQFSGLAGLPEASRPDLFLALADGVDLDALAAAVGGVAVPPGPDAEAADAGRILVGGHKIHCARGALGTLVEGSDLVLGQAGTAVTQAIGLGRPVIHLMRTGDRRKRLSEETAMFGEARLTVAATPEAVTGAAARLLGDDAERARRGAIGQARIGGPGAIAAVIAVLAG